MKKLFVVLLIVVFGVFGYWRQCRELELFRCWQMPAMEYVS